MPLCLGQQYVYLPQRNLIYYHGNFDLLFINVTVDNYSKFEDDYLQVKCGVFTNIKIPYKAIVRFKETRNPISSVGLSIDRLSILFKAQNGGNGNDEVLISPIKKQEFIKILEERTCKCITEKNR